MTCAEARKLRDAYLNQELTEAEALDFEAHVNECETCWRELIALQDLGFDLDDPVLQQMVMSEPTPLPADFTEQVMARVEAERPRGVNVVWPWVRRKWSHRQVASVAYAMSATAVVVGAGEMLYLWNQTTNQLGILAIQFQAYLDASHAYVLGAWQWLAHLI